MLNWLIAHNQAVLQAKLNRLLRQNWPLTLAVSTLRTEKRLTTKLPFF